MTIDHMSPDYHNHRERLYELVAQGKISSVDLICKQSGMDEDSARELLTELIEDGSLNGDFSEDGSRFFLSDVKVSDAPVLFRNDELEIEEVNTSSAKIVAITGLAALILGWIFQRLTGIHPGMANAGVALVMVGLIVMTAGCIQFSRYNPPDNLR